MKKILLCFASFVLMLILLAGCQTAEPAEDVLADTERSASVKTASAASIERLVNNTYRKALGRHKLYCCDEYTDADGTFHATFYGNEDRIEFFVEYDPANKVLKSDAAREYHEKAIRENVGSIIEETTGLQSGELENNYYSVRIKAEMTEAFLEDYDAFISHEGTSIDVFLDFDKKASEKVSKQVQKTVKKLKAENFKGELTYYAGGEFGDEIEF